jgi:flavorubredoxin
MITQELKSMKFNIIDPGLKIQYVPDKEALDSCYAYGRKIGKAVNE